MSQIKLEVCCGSAADAITAYRSGALRAELNSGLSLGGLTPSIGELITIKNKAPEFPVLCMVRPREGGFCYNDLEFETMLCDARILLDNGADGIVFGILNENGSVDAERCQIMLELISRYPGKEAVFHRAIDVVPDFSEALDTLISLGFTRVLTSGQAKTAELGIETIKEMKQYASGRIEILPGCGIRPNNAEKICTETGIYTIHASARSFDYDRSTQKNTDIKFNSQVILPEDSYGFTDGAVIEEFLNINL